MYNKFKILIFLFLLLCMFYTTDAIAMQLFIKNVDGRTITLEVESSYTIEYIKDKIEDKTDIAPGNQRLVFLGRVLEEGRP